MIETKNKIVFFMLIKIYLIKDTKILLLFLKSIKKQLLIKLIRTIF
jgi:hypothetical protein